MDVVVIVNIAITILALGAVLMTLFHFQGDLKDAHQDDRARRKVWTNYIIVGIVGVIIIAGVFALFNAGIVEWFNLG